MRIYTVDMDDLCILYEDLVEMGEIDPLTYSMSDFLVDKVSSAIDYGLGINPFDTTYPFLLLMVLIALIDWNSYCQGRASVKKDV
jgi:hypothetical protein